MLLNAYRFIAGNGSLEGIRAMLAGYRMYREQVSVTGEAAQLSFTRAWTLVRFYERGMLKPARCTCCGGRYVAHAHDLRRRFVCGLCMPPARVGRGRKAAPSAATG